MRSLLTLRIADDFGLDAVGIQHQQGLKDVVPASDLAKALLNNVERPPVRSRHGQRELYAGAALPHFAEVGEGGTLSGCSRPGEIVWSRVYIEDGRLHADIGRGHVVELPPTETQRRLEMTTPEWPIMHAVLHGVGRDELMAQHKANHIQVAHADSADVADRALLAKAALFDALGPTVHLCGDVGCDGPSCPVPPTTRGRSRARRSC